MHIENRYHIIDGEMKDLVNYAQTKREAIEVSVVLLRDGEMKQAIIHDTMAHIGRWDTWQVMASGGLVPLEIK